MRHQPQSLAGLSVLITGAARGIGAATARGLAARGARVALIGHEPAELERTAAACPGAIWRTVDVTDAAGLRGAVDDASATFGGLDAIVANAAIFVTGTIRTIRDDAFERTFDVNVLGVIRTARAGLEHLERRNGYMLVVASVVALAQAPGLGAYAPSKAAVEAFANVLRVEASILGVDVGTAYLSLVDTDMLHGFDASPIGRALHRRVPLPLGSPQDVDAAAQALIRAIERRSRRVVWPRWLRLALPLRGLAQPLLDPYLRLVMPSVERAAQEDIARRGPAAASTAVGAGGRADSAANAAAGSGGGDVARGGREDV